MTARKSYNMNKNQALEQDHFRRDSGVDFCAELDLYVRQNAKLTYVNEPKILKNMTFADALRNKANDTKMKPEVVDDGKVHFENNHLNSPPTTKTYTSYTHIDTIDSTLALGVSETIAREGTREGTKRTNPALIDGGKKLKNEGRHSGKRQTKKKDAPQVQCTVETATRHSCVSDIDGGRRSEVETVKHYTPQCPLDTYKVIGTAGNLKEAKCVDMKRRRTNVLPRMAGQLNEHEDVVGEATHPAPVEHSSTTPTYSDATSLDAENWTTCRKIRTKKPAKMTNAKKYGHFGRFQGLKPVECVRFAEKRRELVLDLTECPAYPPRAYVIGNALTNKDTRCSYLRRCIPGKGWPLNPAAPRKKACRGRKQRKNQAGARKVENIESSQGKFQQMKMILKFCFIGVSALLVGHMFLDFE